MDKKIKYPTKALRDLIIIVIVSIFVFVLSYFFDVFIFIVRFIERHPGSVIYVDEVITALLTLSIAFAVFSWRRLLELKRETSERIRLQEEIIRIADTKAEAERIINRQLRSEIDIRKESERRMFPPRARKKNVL